MTERVHLKWVWPSGSINFSPGVFQTSVADRMCGDFRRDKDNIATSVTTVHHDPNDCTVCDEVGLQQRVYK